MVILSFQVADLGGGEEGQGCERWSAKKSKVTALYMPVGSAGVPGAVYVNLPVGSQTRSIWIKDESAAEASKNGHVDAEGFRPAHHVELIGSIL